MQALTYDAMRADLAATFPGLWMRPLRDFSGQWKDAEGIWMGADETAMPDGQPILWTLECADPDNYDGHVHRAFVAWLKARGWAYELYDPATLFVVPLSYFDLPQGS
ncbi:hypothetical protein [Achromobacter sp.]|uniref:hypothetical protein n=1 Tax=Achromobacter sp. TaxID=134375 RepID=UPI0028AFCF0D|nr:hypothetical protein [Achromobacter sp.]